MAVEDAVAMRELRRECGRAAVGERFGISGQAGVGRVGALKGVKREVWGRMEGAMAVEDAVAVRELRRQCGKFAAGEGFGISGRDGVGRGGALTGVKREVWERMERATAVESAVAVRGLRRQCGKSAAVEGFGFSGQAGVCRGGALTGVMRAGWERMEGAMEVESGVAVRELRRECEKFAAGAGCAREVRRWARGSSRWRRVCC
jgi:hypothetical protein